MKIFKTSFIQVFLVNINVICLSKSLYIGVALFSFLISWFWVSNVKKANIANKKDQLIYSIGAMSGGLCGLLITKLFIK